MMSEQTALDEVIEAALLGSSSHWRAKAAANASRSADYPRKEVMNNRELACKIANDLFTNGAGKHAQRLVLEMPGLKDGGGWCESAVADMIEDHLEAAQTSVNRTAETCAICGELPDAHHADGHEHHS
jgi:hypothetical protein